MSGNTSQTISVSDDKVDAEADVHSPKVVNGNRLKHAFQILLIPGFVVTIWLVFGQLDMLPKGIVPKIQDVLEDWYYWVFGRPGATAFDSYSGSWFWVVLYSVYRVFRGYAVGVILGVFFGILIGWSRLCTRVFDPTIQTIRPIPITAWIPFAIAWFGVEDGSAIFLIALGAFFPVVINTTHGARDINKNLLRAARMMGVTDLKLLWKVILPNALPNIFTGMRLGMGIAWTILIVAEMISVKGGVGYVLWDAYYVSRMEIVVADMITVGMLGYLSDRILVLVQHHFLSWKYFHSE